MLHRSISFLGKPKGRKPPRTARSPRKKQVVPFVSPHSPNAAVSSALQKKEYVFRAFDTNNETHKTNASLRKTDINLAYCPPEHSSPVSFGKKVLQLKKPTNYWKLVHKHRLFSWKYIWIRSIFLIGMSYLLAVLWDEVRRIEEDQRRGGRGQYALAGDALGKQVVPVSQRDVWDDDQVTDMIQKAQDSFMAGDSSSLGDDYEMVKIPRPKEFTFDDVRKR